MHNLTEKAFARLISPASVYFVALVCAANLMVLALSRVDLKWHKLTEQVLFILIAAALYLALKRFGPLRYVPQTLQRRVLFLLAVFSFLAFAQINLRLANQLVMFLGRSRPYIDQPLASIEIWLGWDWPSYVAFVNAHPLFLGALDWSYAGLDLLVGITMTILVIFGYHLNAQRFAQAFLWTTLITIAFGWIYPTIGTTTYYHIPPEYLSNYPKPPGKWMLKAMTTLREAEGIIRINPAKMVGMIAVPSLHTAAAMLMAFSLGRTPLFWPALLYACFVIAATPIFGAHYLADLVAGAVVAVGAHGLSVRLYRSPPPIP